MENFKKYTLINENEFSYNVSIEKLSIVFTSKNERITIDINKKASKSIISKPWRFFLLIIDESAKNDNTPVTYEKVFNEIYLNEITKKRTDKQIKASIKKLLLSINNELKGTKIKISTKDSTYFLNCKVNYNEDLILTNPVINNITNINNNHDSHNIIPQNIYFLSSDNEITNSFSIKKISNNTENTFYSELDSKGRLLLSSPGGQGKTRFLKLLKNTAKLYNKYSFIIYIYLPSLMSLSIIDDISIDEYPVSYLLRDYIKTNNISKDKILKTCKKNHKAGRNNKRILLLLDDYNGLLSSTNTLIKEKIRASIEEVSNNWDNTTIIITTRDSSYKNNNHYKNNNDMKLFCNLAKLSDVPKEICDQLITKYNIKNKELISLLKIPMYFNMLSELDNSSKPSNLYELFDACLQRVTAQKLSASSNSINKELSILMYHIILPYIAQYMNSKLTKTITENECIECIKNILELRYYSNAVFQHLCSLYNHENDYMLPLCNEVNIQTIKNQLLECEYIEIVNNDYSFIHEDWQNFFCSKNIITNISVLLKNHKNINITKEININLNTNVDVSKMAKTALNLIPAINDDQLLETIVSNYRNLFIEATIFDINKSTPNEIYGLVELLYLAFIICDYLQLESQLSNKKEKYQFLQKIEEEKHCIISAFIDNLLQNINNENYLLFIKSNSNTEHLIQIISTEIAYNRRRNNFSHCEKLVTLGYNLSKPNPEIIHQDAKLHLCVFQNQYDKGNYNKNEFIPYFDKLKENSIKNKFYLSTNLFGKLITSPQPFLLKEKLIEINPVLAFYSYFNTTCPNNSKDTRTSRDCEYTIRQALSLLLNGYVKVSPKMPYINNSYILSNKQIVIGDLSPSNIDSNTIALANDLYKLIEGQSDNYLNYIKNQLAWYNNNKYLSNYEFLNPLSYETFRLPYYLQRRYLLKDTNMSFYIKKSYEDLISSISTYTNNDLEKYHPIYKFIDCKLFELSFQNENISFDPITKIHEFSSLNSNTKKIINNLFAIYIDN